MAALASSHRFPRLSGAARHSLASVLCSTSLSAIPPSSVFQKPVELSCPLKAPLSLKKKNNSLLLCSQGFKGKSWTCITTCVSEPKGTAMYSFIICQQAILMAQYVWDTALSTFVRGDHVIEAVVSFLQVKSKNPTIFLTQVYPNNWILILKSKNIWKPFTD